MIENRKPRVLVLTSYFLPGFRAGGPIRSIANLVDALSAEFDFRIVTRDRDLGDEQPYPNLPVGCWMEKAGAELMYVNEGRLGIRSLRALEQRVQPDIVYLNSFFDPVFTIRPLLWRRLGLFADGALVIVAPRGELFTGALRLKAFKKTFFIAVARVLGLYGGVRWQASSEDEAAAILRTFGRGSRIVIAPNLATLAATRGQVTPRPPKRAGSVRLVQIARIARNKNLLDALRVLQGVNANVEFSLFGTIEDDGYWRACERVIEKLPGNVSVRYGGELQPAEVAGELRKHDFFFSLTHGENYGHAIVEALMAGVPVLISDRTPWRGLVSLRAGWDVALGDPGAAVSAIEYAATMSADEYCEWSAGAANFAAANICTPEFLEASRTLLAPVRAP